MNIKLVLTDIDGVWTDGGIFLDETGNEFKKFNTHDSTAAVMLRLMNIPIGIITGEKTKLVERRAQKLKVKFLYMGIINKLAVAEKIVKELNVKWEEVAYIGDDIIDIPLLEKVGISACPNNAPEYVKQYAMWTLCKNSGEAVFREFIDRLLAKQGDWDQAVSLYFESMSKENEQ